MQDCGVIWRESDGTEIGPGSEVRQGHDDDSNDVYHVVTVLEHGSQVGDEEVAEETSFVVAAVSIRDELT